MLLLIPKKVAQERCLSRYFTGVLCGQGHLTERHVADGKCVACRQLGRLKADAHTRQYRKNYYAANKLVIAQKRRIWYAANKEHLAKYFKRWVAANKDYVAAQAKIYGQKNKARKALVFDAWRRANLELDRVRAHNKRAQRRADGGKLSPGLVATLMQQQLGRCACPCARSLSQGFHMDHIVPVSKGGRNQDDNIQLLTPTCNLEKRAKNNEEFISAQMHRYLSETAQ